MRVHRRKKLPLRSFLWIATKSAINPFRRLVSQHLQRRHARFDQQIGIRTTGRVTIEELGLSPDHSVRYEATPIAFFESLLRKLSLDYANTTFIDLGCGKGRTLILAARHPFHSIIGVEISREMCDIAIENIQRYCSRNLAIPNISVICKGIEEYDYSGRDIADHLLIYMYNPCKTPILSAALSKLAQIAAQGTAITIIYLNPTCGEVMANARWLKIVREGETFDELGNCFMPYVVYYSPPHPWKEAVETLVFQFGPWTVAKWNYRSLSNATNPLIARQGPLKIPAVFHAATFQQLPDDGTFSRALSLNRNAIRYVSYRGKRYFIDLSSRSFDAYLTKFSAKTRNTLKRKVRHFADYNGGAIDLRCYRSPEEMKEFFSHASNVSRVSYQGKIGFGFADTEEFRSHIIEEAGEGRVRGFVLMYKGRPVAYVFCRINGDIITYAIPGYDPEFVRFSPGTVLIYAMLKQLFKEENYRIFDFGGQEWDYKALFATGYVSYSKVTWFPTTIKNLLLVMMHYLVLQAWRSAATAKAVCDTARKRFANYVSPRPSARITPKSAKTAAVSKPAEAGLKQARPHPARL
jgi:CelD/BcsL family acetyltransferase involved in cellulose biosynthesis